MYNEWLNPIEESEIENIFRQYYANYLGLRVFRDVANNFVVEYYDDCLYKGKPFGLIRWRISDKEMFLSVDCLSDEMRAVYKNANYNENKFKPIYELIKKKNNGVVIDGKTYEQYFYDKRFWKLESERLKEISEIDKKYKIKKILLDTFVGRPVNNNDSEPNC